jgi:hypothetical protein
MLSTKKAFTNAMDVWMAHLLSCLFLGISKPPSSTEARGFTGSFSLLLHENGAHFWAEMGNDFRRSPGGH